MYNKELLKESLLSEGGFLSDPLLDRFLEIGEIVVKKPKEYIIMPGITDKSIWVIATGFIKAFYFDGKKEIVLGFGGMGTIFLSPKSFSYGKPAFCGYRTITESELLRINRKDFDLLMEESHEFAKWIFGVATNQLGVLEVKTQLKSEKDIVASYKSLIKRQMQLGIGGMDMERKALLNIVSSKDIASYLGITQSYLSNIRKAIIEEERNNNLKQ